MKTRKRKGNTFTAFPLILLWILILCSTAPAQRRGGGGRGGGPPNMPNMPAPQPQPQPQSQPQPQTGQPDAKSYILKLYVDEAGVTAEIVNCPLQTVLQELAERTGIIFEMRTQDNLPVSLRPNQPVELAEFIKRIASGSNTQFFYSQDKSPRIAMVRIFSRTKLPQPSIVYLGAGVATKSNDVFFYPGQAFRALQENNNTEAREKAINYLVSNKSEGAAEVLMKCVSDPEPKIRIASIDGLAALDARSALPAIVKSLKDSQASVRQSAAAAIALIGDQTNIKDLKPLISDRDDSVVAAANIAIQKLSATSKK
jgi:hypothetical protein